MRRGQKMAWVAALILVLGVFVTAGTTAAWPQAGAMNDAALLLIKDGSNRDYFFPRVVQAFAFKEWGR